MHVKPSPKLKIHGQPYCRNVGSLTVTNTKYHNDVTCHTSASHRPSCKAFYTPERRKGVSLRTFTHHRFFRPPQFFLIGKSHTKRYSSCHWSPQKRDRNGWEQAEKESIDVLCPLRWCGTRHQRKFTQQRSGRQSTPMEESKIWDGRRIWKVVSLWNVCVLRNFKIPVTMATYINHEKIA